MVEEKKRKEKDRTVKALAGQMVENTEELQRTEGVQRPSMSQAVVPRLIRGVLSSEWMAHEITSEAAQNWEKIPKVSGSGPFVNLVSDFELDSCEDCFQYICQGNRCTQELKGKAKSCIPCWDNKRCEPVGASGAHPPLRRIVEGAQKWKQAGWWATLWSCSS